jgi:anti-sigma B factor antagonist
MLVGRHDEGMNTELTDATRQGTALQEPRWTLTGPDGTTELRVDVSPGAPPYAGVHGEIDILAAQWLREELLSVILWHGPGLVLDLSGVTFMDCAGINLLLASRRRARLAGGRLRVIGASAAASRIIAMTGLQQELMPAADCQGQAALVPGSQIPASRRDPDRFL